MLFIRLFWAIKQAQPLISVAKLVSRRTKDLLG